MLYSVLQFILQEYIKPYITSITSMEATHVLEAVRDARGSHVIEAFLCSGAPGKQKRRLVTKYVFQLYLLCLCYLGTKEINAINTIFRFCFLFLY